MGILRQALRNKSQGRAQNAVPATLSAPIGGWNTRDALPDMNPRYASVMDNWFPDSDGVKLRAGSNLQSVVTNEVPKRLAALQAGAVSKLIAFSLTKIWDVSTDPGTSIGTGFTTYDWTTSVFANRLIMVNGVDTEQQYDGTTLAPLAFTGHPVGVKFLGCHAHNGRMYYWAPETQTFYYTTVAGTFQGTVAAFDLSTISTEGGHIVTMQSWSISGGVEGATDLLAIFFTSGQVLLYAGSDPGDATDFSKQGRFDVAPLLGPRMALKFGGDVIMGTIDGYLPLSKAISLGALTDQISISDTIQPSIRQAAVAAPGSTYWSAVLYSFGDTDGKGGMLIFNAPGGYSAGGAEIVFQHVMNTRTGAWCRFAGLNSYDWEIWEKKPYFAADGGIYQFNVGTADVAASATTPITGTTLQAYSDLGMPGMDKIVKGVRPIVRTDGPVPIGIGIAVDFAGFPVIGTQASTTVAGPDWDVTAWDIAFWGQGPSIQKNWSHVPAIGEYLALGVQIITGTQAVTWYSTKLLIEQGGVIGIGGQVG